MTPDQIRRVDALFAPGGLAGKRVTVMGVGLLGRGVGDIAFFADRGATLLATDLKDAEALATSVAALSERENVRFRLGGHVVEDFTGADLVLKPAGCPLDSPYVAAATAAGVPVAMSTALFARYAPSRIMGVTGTRGKSTVTHWIHHALGRLGAQARLGGNVRGMSTLAGLDAATDAQTHVLELDSWQLQGFDALRMSPSIAAFTTFLPDHMNYYRGDMERYFDDKAAIYRWQASDETLVVGDRLTERLAAAPPPGRRVDARPIAIPQGAAALGPHGRWNAGIALECVAAAGAERAEALRALEDWPGVAGRLYRIGSLAGRDVYDDGNATTAEAAAAAVAAFEGRAVALVFGGTSKGLPLAPLIEALDGRADVAPVLLPGGGSEAFLAEAGAALRARTRRAADMAEALEAALESVGPGGVIALSPAFASFEHYANEYARSEAFQAAAAAAGLRRDGADGD